MINILPIQTHQIKDAKYVITAVAQRIYMPEKNVQYFWDILEAEGELMDVDNFQQAYNKNRGLFLVALDDEKVVGTGAIKKMEEDSAELKRLWLLEEYHGQKIGYQIVLHLLDFAHTQGYRRLRLQTSEKQIRAIQFYKQLGFYEIPSYRESMDNISMELTLQQREHNRP